MERREGVDPKNLEWLRAANFQPFSLPESYLQPLLAAGNNPLIRPEINPYHPMVDSFQNLGMMDNPTTFPDTLYDFQLESEFARLNLSTPSGFIAPQPAYAVNGGGRVSSVLRNNNALVDLNFSNGMAFNYPQTPQLSNGDLQRLRIHSAARGQMGLFMQPQNYQENLDSFTTAASANLNTIYDNFYSRRSSSLNGAATGYRPRAYRNGEFAGLINSNRNLDYRIINNGNLQYRGANNYNNSSSLMSALHNGSLYRPKQRTNYTSLEDLRGKIFSAAKDQNGCRFLQMKFEEKKPEEIHMIFSELKDNIGALMIDQFGNYLIQKLFEVCNEEQITQLLLLVINDERNLMAICLDMHGTRAMQKLLEHLTTAEQRSLVISVLRRITVTLTKSMNGHHVIQHCLKFFSSEDVKQILNVVAESCLDIASDKSGCCVLQQCVAHAQGEPKERLLAEITANALVLSEHPYGNYVVQYILGLRLPRATADILKQLEGNYVSLSLNKYGSNVVEKCLRESDGDQAFKIINEILKSPNFLMVVQDPYGNYVAQSAFAIAKGPHKAAMNEFINIHYPFLHSHPHGKRVLACARGSKQRV